MKKILVTGVNGQLGHDVIQELERRNIPCKGVDIGDFDITDSVAVAKYFQEYAPTAVIHCAAYTAVDRAEDNAERCASINVEGTRNIAACCADLDASMIYISTDYVFPGVGTQEYEVDDAMGPLSVYGKTKLEGEQVAQQLLDKLFIVRISWAFGENGDNFVKTMLKLASTRDSVSVVNDQIGSPTYTADLAVLLCDMIATQQYGVYHATNEGYCSWAEFAAEIFRLANLPVRVVPIASKDYPTKAVRPLNSRLSKKSLDNAAFKRLRSWEDALEHYLFAVK